jgi:hypothetical protein
VARTLLLVAASDVYHGCSVERCTRAGTNADADTGTANGLRRARVATDGSTVTRRSGGGRSRVLLVGNATVKACTRLHREAWVDHGHQSANGCSWVAIDVADRSVEVELQLINKVGGNVRLCECGHVTKLLGRIIRHQCIHLDILRVDAQAICDTLRQEREDLADGCRATSDETVVQSVVETDLDKRAVRWLFWHATRRLDQARHVGREASRRSCGGTVGSKSAAGLTGVGGAWRRGSRGRREGELSWDFNSSGIVSASRDNAVRSLTGCRGGCCHGRRLRLGRDGHGYDSGRRVR